MQQSSTTNSLNQRSASYKHPKVAQSFFNSQAHQLRQSTMKSGSDSNLLRRPVLKIDSGSNGNLLLIGDVKHPAFQSESPLKPPAMFEEAFSAPPKKQVVARIASGRAMQVVMQELPTTSMLKFKIYSNWGDSQYVGLVNIEVFNSTGARIEPQSTPFTSKCITRDSQFMWRRELRAKQPLELRFSCRQAIAMIRVWNYNQSRTYSSQGVRLLGIENDQGRMIFFGEVRQAKGTCSPEDNFECMMFTSNQDIMRQIDQNDWLSHQQQQERLEGGAAPLPRPDTATFQSRTLARQQPQQQHGAVVGAARTVPKINTFMSQPSTSQQGLSGGRTVSLSKGIKVRSLILRILNNWGDHEFVGLTEVEVLDRSSQPIKFRCSSSALQNGQRLMTRPESMWQAAFRRGLEIRCVFERETEVAKLRIWNFNAPRELEKGVSLMAVVTGEGQLLTPAGGVLVRKGIGQDEFDYSQVIQLPATERTLQPVPIGMGEWRLHQQEYEVLHMPQGLKVEIKLVQTWGDVHYIGLNGIEFLDENGRIVSVSPNRVACNCNSMDIRTHDNLMNGKNITLDDRNMWLAPFMNSPSEQFKINGNNPSFGELAAPRNLNSLVFTFEQPIQLAGMVFYNYSKEPTSRGTKEIEILMDDRIVFKGYLNISTLVQRQQIEGNNLTTVLFTQKEEIVNKMDFVSIRESIIGCETVFVNENQKFVHNTINNQQVRQQCSAQAYKPQPLKRPETSVKVK